MTRHPIRWTPRARRIGDAAGLLALLTFGVLVGISFALWLH